MKLSRLLPLFLTSVLLTLCCPDSGAQLKPEELSARSRMMFVDGDCKFLAVEMIKDGFIKAGEDIKISYSVDGYFANGKKVPEPFASRYSALMSRFSFENPRPSGSMSCGPLTMQELSAPYKPQHKRYDEPSDNLEHIIDMLADDNLVPKEGTVAIYMTNGVVTVNGHELKTPLEEIYKQRITLLCGFRHLKAGSTFGILVKH